MKTRSYYVIWVKDQAARAFLWADAAEKPSRWAFLAEFLGYEEAGVGIWVRLVGIREIKDDADDVEWKITQPECLLFWNFIITARALGESPNTNPLGFRRPGEPAANT